MESSFVNWMEVVQHWGSERSHAMAFRFLCERSESGDEVEQTYAELDLEARCIAAYLQKLDAQGERVLLLYPPGLDFIMGFLGCLYAGAVAVPAYPPDPTRPGRALSRLVAIAADAQPKAALTTTSALSQARALIQSAPELEKIRWQASDTLHDPSPWRPPTIARSTLAYLQYTSGSTGTPKGVMVSHGNLLDNAQAIDTLTRRSDAPIAVGWVPLYHDMGLIANVLESLYRGRPCTLLSPLHFLRRPFRWLQAISDLRATYSGAPNFAYDLCVRKTSAEQREQLDLSAWDVAFVSAEPVRIQTLERFAAAFAPCGFRRQAFLSAYGLAEATLVVSGGWLSSTSVLSVRTEALKQNRVEEATMEVDEQRRLVSCGSAPPHHQVMIVDPERRTRCAAGQVGEIWVRGPSVAQGYWNRPAETAETFEAHTIERHEGPFLRTGDLGFVHDGELFITGRCQDLIIIRGRNHYPQDIEHSIERSHSGIRPGCSAAFSLDMHGEERLAVVAEVAPASAEDDDLEGVLAAVRTALAEQHELSAYAIALLKARSIPKTSSGKIQRHACREGLERGTLAILTTWRSDAVPPVAAMASPSIREKAFSVIARATGYPAEKLQDETRLIDLGFDSLTLTSLIGELEDAFGPRLIAGRLTDASTTVGTIVNLLDPGGVTEPHDGDLLSATPPPSVDTAPVRVAAPPSRATHPPGGMLDTLHESEEIRTTLMLIAALEIENPYFRPIEGSAGARVRIGDREYINFATYNYLGLSSDARVCMAATRAIADYGTSASASRVASGERPLYRELEQELAGFLGCEDAIVFASGHATNVTVIGRLFGPQDLILHDSLAHDSILQGATLAGARRRAFPHNDIAALERLLRDLRPGARRVLIAIEGAYSMDGDLAPLADIVALKNQYEALLLVDEAHSLGVVGKTGRGIGEHARVARNEVELWMGTLSKALASCGGYIAGSARLIEYLKYTAPGFVFAAAITPANAAAALAALRILAAEPDRVKGLQQRAERFRALCWGRGVNTGTSSDTAIIPAIVGGSVQCIQLSDALARRGVNVQPIVYPAVQDNLARLRFFVSALHTDAQLESTACALVEEIERLAPRRRVARTPPAMTAPEVAPSLAPARWFPRVFLTGASGFIGSRVARRLVEAGVEIRCLLRSTSRTDRLSGLKFEVETGDLHDLDALRRGVRGCDAVIHLACTSSWADIRAEGERVHTVAVDGTRNVLEAAFAAGVDRFVHVSSVAALNASEEPRVFDETTSYDLEGRGLFYSLAKRGAEQVVFEYGDRGLDVVIVLPAEVYGANDDQMITAGTLVDILHAAPPAACDGGTSVVHVDDVAHGIVQALGHGRPGERYILGGENLSIRELAEEVLRLAGRSTSVVDIPNRAAVRLCHDMAAAGMQPPIPLDVIDYATLYWFVDSTKAKRELGYQPRDATRTLAPVVEWLLRTRQVR